MIRIPIEMGQKNNFDISQLMPGLAVDNVIFGFHENQLKVLLLECMNHSDWMLPGGFIFRDESVDNAAARVLYDRTGLDEVFLQQFHVFGDPDRTRESLIEDVMKSMELDYEENRWLFRRFISVGYYALVEYEEVEPVPDHISLSCNWFDVSKLPDLILDHREIILSALSAMRQHLNYQPIGYNLLPKEFPMKSLQLIYETILDKKLDRSNFNRKMLASGLLVKKEKLFGGGAHKAPYLYSFKKKEYFKVLREGFSNVF